MQPPSRPKFGKPLTFDCPRCGDTFPCATDDDRFEISVHRLLHVAGDLKRSLWPATHWATNPDSLSDLPSTHPFIRV